ncbi:hypothetical protein [Saccharococcus thermophilus]|uniref:DUF5683 domain-containing protein n=1 Tax=Saccharococcus thermophilus TaxID=29396 RepID=A0A846MDP7_9BACL|nr:hypothetical protein [Saccharococcus thermophilus]NIK15008.1 hypothetical protein [Saccharococcus thermophilus]
MRNIAALFSILMPGFGQIYNGQLMKGTLFIIVEHFHNIFGRINQAIHLDFNGLHQQAVETTNFGYLLLYPGFYAYCVWDAWYNAKPNADKTKTAIPFITGGFLGEIGAIFGNRLPIPTLTIAMLMIIPMICGMIVFRDQ